MEEKSHSESSRSGKGSGIGLVILILLVVGLLGAVGFLVFRDQEHVKVIEANVEEIKAGKSVIASQQAELDQKIAEIDEWIKRVEDLQISADSLDFFKNEMLALKRSLALEKNRNHNFKAEKDKLNARISEYLSRITELETKNEEIQVQMKDTLEFVTRSYKDTLGRYMNQKKELQDKVEIASVLRAEEIKINAISIKGKEVEAPVYKSKQLNKVRITFFLGENKVAPRNMKNIMMRMVEPDGTVLFSNVEGGSFTTVDNEEKMYTMSQNVQFDGNRQKLTFMYVKGSDFKSGKHNIEIYADGHKIGTSSFQVK